MPIYASEQFLKSESSEYGWIGGIGASSGLRCILPYTVVRKAGFRMIRFRTACVPLAGDLTLEEEKSFLGSAVEYFRSTGAGMIIPSGNSAIFRTFPDGAAAAPYGTVLMNLCQSEEALLSAVRTTTRQNIRKATAAGIVIKCGMEYLDASYYQIAETLKRSEVSFKTFEDFKTKISSFGEFVRVFVAEHNGIIQGCMVSPFSEHTAYSCYAGSLPAPVRGAMPLLHWEAIDRKSTRLNSSH